MTTTCPKCRHVRRPNEDAPDWQCPACGVAYVKAAEADRSAPSSMRTSRFGGSQGTTASGIAWGKLLLLAAMLWGGWKGVQVARHESLGFSAFGGAPSTEELTALAATVRPGEVLMYSTTECPYAAQARAWLNQYGFAFTECNMSVNTQCEQEFTALGANGTPYLIVRGHHMKDGFDSDEFLAALGERP